MSGSRWPEATRRTTNGCCVARCPACAEHGQDAKGEHLWWNPATGAYGCVVYSGDVTHRQRIRELVGLPAKTGGEDRPVKVCRPLQIGQPLWSGFKKSG